MIYSKEISTELDTSKSDPLLTTIKVTNGLIYQLEVDFPPGSSGLMGVQIFDKSYQLYPSTPGEWFLGDNRLLKYPDLYLKASAPFEFTIKTYNEDTLFDHTVYIRIGMVSRDIFISHFLPELGYQQIIDIMEKLKEEDKQSNYSEIQRTLDLLT